MMKKQVTLEHTLYVLAIILAIALRFIRLGSLPLSDYEANLALQSLELVNGTHPSLGPNPGYIHLTAILFAIFGESNFWARFWPALLGSALVMVPWFLRGKIGRYPALILAFGLTFDPGLNAISRLAGGPMLAISCSSFAIVLWSKGKRPLAGFFTGLAMLGGPSIWMGLSGLLIAWAFHTLYSALINRRIIKNEEKPEGEIDDSEITSSFLGRQVLVDKRELKHDFIQALAWGSGAFVVIGSLLLFSPQGLAAFVQSTLVFFKGWWTSANIPLGRVYLVLPAYELLPLIFCLVGLVRGIVQRRNHSSWLIFWLLAALLLPSLYAGRQVADLAWTILPLWILAAVEMGSLFHHPGINRWVVAAVIAVIFILVVLAWLILAQLSTIDPLSSDARLHWAFISGIFLVIAIGLILVGTGWSVSDASLGGAWGFTIPLVLFTLAMTTGAAGVREPRTYELWNPEPRLGRAELVVKVANDISRLNTGFDSSLPLSIISLDSPALRWMMRDWDFSEAMILGPEESPELVITPGGIDLTLTAEYRGESLVWREVGDWANASFSTWMKWFIYRQIPVLKEQIILWVRADLMLDNQGINP